MGGVPLPTKICSNPVPTWKIPPPTIRTIRLAPTTKFLFPPHQKAIPPPPNKNFKVITQ